MRNSYLPRHVIRGNVNRQALWYFVCVWHVVPVRYQLHPERNELRYCQQDGNAPYERDTNLEKNGNKWIETISQIKLCNLFLLVYFPTFVHQYQYARSTLVHLYHKSIQVRTNESVLIWIHNRLMEERERENVCTRWGIQWRFLSFITRGSYRFVLFPSLSYPYR